MRQLRKYTKLIIGLALPVYLMLLGNSMMNMHMHVLSNGMVVMHAHPNHDGGKDGKHHHHSNKEISYYQGFCLNYFNNATEHNIPIVDFPVLAALPEIAPVFYSSEQTSFAQLRAPPIS